MSRRHPSAVGRLDTTDDPASDDADPHRPGRGLASGSRRPARRRRGAPPWYADSAGAAMAATAAARSQPVSMDGTSMADIQARRPRAVEHRPDACYDWEWTCL